MEKKIKEIQQSIRDLRDGDSHVCPLDLWEQAIGEGQRTGAVGEAPECTCEKYDQVIDALGDMANNIY